MYQVADVMTRKVLTIASDANADDAAWGLTIRGIHGAPVQDAHGNLIGVISKSDLLDPGREQVPHEKLKVGDAMTPLLFAIRETDGLMDAVRRMTETGAHRLVVVDEAGKLAGLLTPMDVLHALVRMEKETGKSPL